METGFFSMDLINQINKIKDLNEAKQVANSAVNSFKNAKIENTRKALSMVGKCRTVNELVIGMSNFLLAHPSEGLKAIR